MPESARNAHVRRDKVNTVVPAPLTSTTNQAKTSTTDVLTAVARWEFTPSTPTLARMAVAPAKNAESRDHVSQFMR